MKKSGFFYFLQIVMVYCAFETLLSVILFHTSNRYFPKLSLHMRSINFRDRHHNKQIGGPKMLDTGESQKEVIRLDVNRDMMIACRAQVTSEVGFLLL
jgi:hypothetical protein